MLRLVPPPRRSASLGVNGGGFRTWTLGIPRRDWTVRLKPGNAHGRWSSLESRAALDLVGEEKLHIHCSPVGFSIWMKTLEIKHSHRPLASAATLTILA